MGEYRLETTAKAAMVLDLMNKVEGGDADYPLSYYVDAAKDYSTLEEAERGLIKECPLCGDDNMPVHEVKNLIHSSPEGVVASGGLVARFSNRVQWNL